MEIIPKSNKEYEIKDGNNSIILTSILQPERWTKHDFIFICKKLGITYSNRLIEQTLRCKKSKEWKQTPSNYDTTVKKESN